MSDEHQVWLSGLDFYKTELAGLKARLTDIAGKNSGKEIAAEVEHFENQFQVQAENIDILKHQINDNLSKIASAVQGNSAGYINADLIAIHDGKKEQYTAIEKVINDLRQEFNRFSSQWM